MVNVDRYAADHPQVTDAVIVLALLGGAVLGVYMVGPGETRPADPWVGMVVTGLACLAVFGARLHPRLSAVVVTAATLVTGVLGYPLTPLLLAPVMVALYWLAAATTTRVTWVYGGIATVLVVGVAVGVDVDATAVLRALGPALWLVLPLALGSRTRLRQAYLEAVQARAEHAERTREEEARLRVTEERMRIARDLHDVVAHHMAVANAQAGTAAHLFDVEPALARQILSELQTTTSTVMLELRDTVGVLRRAGETDALEPAPGLAQLPQLLEVCRSAGLAVESEIEGQPRDLSSGVDLTAYRIIQEALTNATKYATPATASVRLRYSGTDITITVANPTRRLSDRDRPGYGIIGMRERAHAVGGELRVHEGTVFEVVALLPMSPHTRQVAP